ncbi:MAG TPA: phosphatidate cytidylyltransferase [Gemmataceae bacterium]|nr:phosphatidate cytidylyltransferase [Gemmataceae bacterium]
MTEATRQRLFGAGTAFDEPVVVGAVIGVVAVLALSGALLFLLRRSGRVGPKTAGELLLRWKSWCWLSALMLAPVLLGAAWVMAAVCVLSLLCYREYARATGLFRDKTISLVVVLGTLAVTFAVVDHYNRLFFATAALTVGLVAVVTIPQDRPQGYIQRVALGALGFLLFGYSLGYVGLIGNDARYRSVLILLLAGVELNDVFAYCVGRLVGGPKLLPNTSPGKTVAGSAAALVLTTALVAGLGHVIFRGTAVGRVGPLLGLGVLVSVVGQLGALMLSSIKRDVHVKDVGAAIPGHGGLLDRFDSLVLVPPALFHYLSLFLGPLGAGQAERILTGG